MMKLIDQQAGVAGMVLGDFFDKGFIIEPVDGFQFPVLRSNFKGQ